MNYGLFVRVHCRNVVFVQSYSEDIDSITLRVSNLCAHAYPNTACRRRYAKRDSEWVPQ